MLHDVKPNPAPSVQTPSAAHVGTHSQTLANAKADAALAAVSAAGTPGGSPAVDRRRSARKASNLPAWLSDQSGGRRPQQQRVTVTDMSMHGVGFVASEKVEIGATHWIVVAADQLHLSTRLKIIFSRQRADGTWDVGGEFF
jgi:hypothetical protein